MRLSYSETWNDAVRQIRLNRPLLAGIAGVFLFLPSLLIAWLLPVEAVEGQPRLELFMRHVEANWPWLLAGHVLEMIGAISIYSLLLKRDGRTVGGAIAGSLALLPTYFFARLAAAVAVGLGLFALVVPGLYLIGRLAPLGAALVAEDHRNPIAALKRAFALTRGAGWAVFGLLLLVYVTGFIANVAVTNVLGILFILVAGRETGVLLALILGCAIMAAVAVVVIVLLAAIYTRLAARPEDQPASGT